jgi:predicted nucleic acid-binding protein
VTIGYLDSSALAVIMLPGDAGQRGAEVWNALDSACTHHLSEIEVPAEIGRDLNRFSWVWAVNLLAMVSPTEEIHAAAIDLAWLGAPASTAVHVATAISIQVDHFLTANAVNESWAQLRGLHTIRL